MFDEKEFQKLENEKKAFDKIESKDKERILTILGKIPIPVDTTETKKEEVTEEKFSINFFQFLKSLI